jgi:thiamine-phosphate pyrophosphorylase
MNGLYVITDRRRGHVEVAQAALEGGARIIQLRDKHASTWQLVAWAEKIRRLCERHRALFLVNDRVDVSMASGAWGVHLGTEDMPLPHARRLMGSEAIIGASVANLIEAKAAVAGGASYVAVGSIYETSSKDDAGEPVGVGVLAEIAAEVKVPVVAIGGITAERLAEIRQAGAACAAVMSAVSQADDMVEATRRLVSAWAEAGALLRSPR